MRNQSRILFFVFIFLVLNMSINCLAQEIQINTENGIVAGKKIGIVNIFKGIPYAAPPVGELRWNAPQPVQNWKGVRQCTEFSPSPMQTKPVPFRMWTKEFISPPEPLSEDCLYLNIWSPASTSAIKLPVFVWIYGGGFVSGSAACAVYDGEEYAKKGVIFVSINYRVGVFGFLAHPELTRESGTGSSGNYGILDQIASLNWIKRNISAFGGDPENVTIAGQSAGAMSVTVLLASPKAANLFQRAIAESGGIFSSRNYTPLSDAEKSGLKFMQNLHAADISALRKLSSEEILKNAWGAGFGRYAPVWDGVILPSDPKSINDVPVISGWVTGDAMLGQGSELPREEYNKRAMEKYGSMTDEFLQLFPSGSKEELKKSQAKFSIISFAGMTSHILAGINKKSTYLYEYSHVPPDKPGFPNYGAFHTS
jgi:para-nitrobenzyl esterase